MGFRWKIMFSSIILVAIAVSVSGYLLLNLSYSRRWESEIEQSVEENRLICATVATGLEAAEEAAAAEGLSAALQIHAAGEQVTVIDAPAGSEYVHVRYYDYDGWVWNGYLY